MKIQNTYDELLFAAAHAGLEPDADDLAAVRVPAGEDGEKFRSTAQATARRIVALRKQGAFGEARSIAEAAQNDYLQQFEALMPIPAAQQAKQPTEDIQDLGALGSRMFGR